MKNKRERKHKHEVAEVSPSLPPPGDRPGIPAERSRQEQGDRPSRSELHVRFLQGFTMFPIEFTLVLLRVIL